MADNDHDRRDIALRSAHWKLTSALDAVDTAVRCADEMGDQVFRDVLEAAAVDARRAFAPIKEHVAWLNRQ